MREPGGSPKIGVLGGAFDPPHNGHVALARAAISQFGLERLVVLVVASPGHKPVEADPDSRLLMAEAAFGDLPGAEVRRDEHARTIDGVRAGEFDGALFVVGADEFADFLDWKEPDELLEHVRLGVATRPGYPRERLEHVLAGLRRPDRVTFFEIEPLPIASRDLRSRLAAGQPVDGLVPPAVAGLIRSRGLYRLNGGLH
jgi:nicotinate-nucleotide adenylyltransferase